MDIVKFILFFVGFSLFFYLGHWLVVRSVLRAFNIDKSIRLTTLILTLVLILLLFSERFIWDPIRPLIFDYIGVLSFAATTFFIGNILYWLCGKMPWRLVNYRSYTVLLLAITLLLSLFSSYQYFFKPVVVENIAIISSKVQSEIRIAHISDTQLGTTSLERMNMIVETLIQLKPDVIAFTGDIVDSSHYKASDFDVFRQSPYPIMFIRGNHEMYHDADRLLQYLKDIKPLQVLQDQKIGILGVDIYGVDYIEDDKMLRNKIRQFKPDEKVFSIFLYHKPAAVDVALQQGFDLLLYGHTHGGQIFPWTLLVDLIYSYADGLFKIGDQYVYTTDGASLWGPRMRLNSQNEVAIITVKPL